MTEEAVVKPGHRKDSFTCPHCRAHAQQHWAVCITQSVVDGDEVEEKPGIEVSTCLVCKRQAIWRTYYARPGGNFGFWKVELLYPRAVPDEVPQLNSDAPTDVADLYQEAAGVLPVSPRAASALLRLALEALLRDLYPDEDNLNNLIGLAVRDGLPERVQKTMDILRFNGNQSVHDLRHEDTVETASTLFQLLNIVVDQLVSQPKQLDQMYGTLPQGVRDKIERRDGSSSA